MARPAPRETLAKGVAKITQAGIGRQRRGLNLGGILHLRHGAVRVKNQSQGALPISMAKLPQSLGNSAFLTFMGQCKDSEQLKETIACSQDCTALKQLLWSEDHSDSSASSEPFLIQEEIHRIGQLASNVSELSKELKREISTLKEIRQKVRNRKNENIDVTKEIFASLRKALDEREEQIITDIKAEAERRENNLEVKIIMMYSV